jgi:hypothetical protein
VRPPELGTVRKGGFFAESPPDETETAGDLQLRELAWGTRTPNLLFTRQFLYPCGDAVQA